MKHRAVPAIPISTTSNTWAKVIFASLGILAGVLSAVFAEYRQALITIARVVLDSIANSP